MEDPFVAYYGHVLVVDTGAGTPYCLRLDARGHYTLMRAGRTLWSGAYGLERGLLCLAHWHDPMAMCFPYSAHPVVDAPWSAPHGESTYTLALRREVPVACGP